MGMEWPSERCAVRRGGFRGIRRVYIEWSIRLWGHDINHDFFLIPMHIVSLYMLMVRLLRLLMRHFNQPAAIQDTWLPGYT